MSAEQNLKKNTYEYGANAAYIAEMYELYLKNPSSVSADWQQYFSSFGDSIADLTYDFIENPWGKDRTQIVGFTPKSFSYDRRRSGKGRRTEDKLGKGGVPQEVLDSINAQMLISAYRARGHLIANLDPLGLKVNHSHPELDPARYGFTDADYNRQIAVGGWLGYDKLTLNEILSILKSTYCNTFAIEYVHIQSEEKRKWLEERIETSLGKPNLSKEQKKHILKLLVETVGFEEFLHKKYPGTKRFSSEGGDALMPACDAVVTRAAELGVEEVVLGMPHRGRLNVLTGFMGKPYVAMLSEFNGNLAMPDNINSSGDVKYHQGFSSDKEFGGRKVHLSLTSNPSHLEAVNPVVTGKVRAKQDQKKDKNREKVLGLLLHGDAAFCGQGIVAETFAMSELEAYKTGGTFHIVVNNQVGFTTSPEYGHKSPYPTDFAMIVQAPIFHVNGDDPEAVVHACFIGAEYRAKFQQDVVLDVWCYRKHGHNEGDEPRWTQPKMYKVIDSKETPREVYAQRLISEGTITSQEFEAMKQAFYDRLETAYQGSNSYKPEKADMLEGKWSGLTQKFGEAAKIETGVNIETLRKIGKKLSEVPQGFNVHKGVERVLSARKQMAETGENLDWAMGELLAFGSILLDGKNIRFTGQDVIRGTFSHRHSGAWDTQTEEIFFPLNNIEPNQKAKAEIVNSLLSEFAVLGYEYGYSQAEPNSLVLWEAQFGDFVNGAQVMIDQFITSAEIKWLRMSGLVMLLPHAYEGQGPEHSSARLERFLQQCAEENIIVANCTTPANYFHILRRQVCRDFRKPLIMMSPKSLLRHKLAVSKLEEMAEGSTFKRVLPEIDSLKADSKIRKLLICSGKVYYDLLEERRNKKIDDVAIIRLEQFYPFPDQSLAEEISKYKNAEIFWVQEEPENMGGWQFVDRKLEKVLVDCKSKSSRPRYIGRPAAAATACGYMKVHKHQQDLLIKEALG
ncbi:MAG: 2-oxoglutarate dehydrogenase E1 component [Rickettsiales bacterium]|nr:2-oxoglutarate dehydrogenase E1 component [Rickettsiales bacterium]